MLQARLLGRFEIWMDGRPVTIPTRPAQSLIAYLLLHPNQHHRREMLAGRFWPESPESNARSNLRHELWRIRKALGPGAEARLQSDGLGVVYHPQPEDQCDVETLDTGAAAEVSTGGLLNAVSAFRGELLPGFYEEWVALERNRLQAVLEGKLERLLDALVEEGRWDETLEWAERWIALGGTPEPAYRALMLARAGQGNLAGAVAEYERCVEALDRVLGVEPGDETRHALARIRSQAVGGTGTPRAVATPSIPASVVHTGQPKEPAPVFVAREAELARLTQTLEKALSGKAQLALVRGEAGSGKTALLSEFSRRSQGAHPELVIAKGTCDAFFGEGDPYLPFRDVMNMLAAKVAPAAAEAPYSRLSGAGILADWPTVLTDEKPDSKESGHHESLLTTMPAKVQLFDQCAAILEWIAAQRPLLLMLDDLQWMDAGTGELLFHLVRRLQNAHMLIVGAYRMEEVNLGRNGARHPLAPLLNEFQSQFGDVVVDLDSAREASGRDFVEAYLDSEPNRLDQRFREELHRRTQGHPLFTIQLLRSLQERGKLRRDDQGNWIAGPDLSWEDLPPQVEGIIAERIGRLGPELQNLLLAASVEGEQFTMQVLRRVQGTEERILLQQLSRDLAQRHRLVRELAEVHTGDRVLVRFQFTHALIQQYLYRQLGEADRASLHKEIAETLEDLYQKDSARIVVPLARHYCEAGIRDKAVKYLLQAGDQARGMFAHQAAEAHYRRALGYLREMDANEQIARTLMKLYLVYQNAFDFPKAQQALEESHALWRQLNEGDPSQSIAPASNPYRLAALKAPVLDPGLCETIFQLESIQGLFCGLVERSEDETLTPWAASRWEVQDDGRRYVFHMRENLMWTDGTPLTAEDFVFAWKRILQPGTQYLQASLLYDVRGARDYHQGRLADESTLGISAPDPHTLVIELAEPCGYFPYILADPVSYAVPRHVIQSEGNAAWTDPRCIATSGAFQLESGTVSEERILRFIRNPRCSGASRGNVQQVTINLYANEFDMYKAFVAGELDSVEFVLPQLHQPEWRHFQEAGLLHTSTLPFVDAVYFVCDQPPFDDPGVRRAFALAIDKEDLAGKIEDKVAATGGYIPPSLPGHTEGLGLRYAPEEARRLLAAAGFPGGRGFPTTSILVGIAGLEEGDDLISAYLQEMWKKNLGVSVQKCRGVSVGQLSEDGHDFHLFFTGWFADYVDPAAFLQTNFLLERCHWRNPSFDELIENGRHTLNQDQRLDLYREADRILMEEAAIVPLFYGHIYELRQPWVHRPSGSSKFSHHWKDIILAPH